MRRCVKADSSCHPSDDLWPPVLKASDSVQINKGDCIPFISKHGLVHNWNAYSICELFDLPKYLQFCAASPVLGHSCHTILLEPYLYCNTMTACSRTHPQPADWTVNSITLLFFLLLAYTAAEPNCQCWPWLSKCEPFCAAEYRSLLSRWIQVLALVIKIQFLIEIKKHNCIFFFFFLSVWTSVQWIVQDFCISPIVTVFFL